MRMRPWLRKLVLSVHLIVSVGWIGAVAAYIAFDVATVTSADPGVLRAAYAGMELIVQRVTVPFAIATLITGIIISFGTRWGLFRHYWVVISLLLTTVATVVLLLESRTVSALAGIATDPATTPDELSALNPTLVHSIGGLIVLVAILVLNIYKPRGMTRYGWRKKQELQPNSSKAGRTRRV